MSKVIQLYFSRRGAISETKAARHLMRCLHARETWRLAFVFLRDIFTQFTSGKCSKIPLHRSRAGFFPAAGSGWSLERCMLSVRWAVPLYGCGATALPKIPLLYSNLLPRTNTINAFKGELWRATVPPTGSQRAFWGNLRDSFDRDEANISCTRYFPCQGWDPGRHHQQVKPSQTIVKTGNKKAVFVGSDQAYRDVPSAQQCSCWFLRRLISHSSCGNLSFHSRCKYSCQTLISVCSMHVTSKGNALAVFSILKTHRGWDVVLKFCLWMCPVSRVLQSHCFLPKTYDRWSYQPYLHLLRNGLAVYLT